MPTPRQRSGLILRGGAAFTPASLSGLVLSLNAQKLTGFANNDPVASWPDLSGHSNDAGQVTSGKRPLYKTAQINGFPAVVFDATDDYLVTPTIDLAGGAGVTIFAVFFAAGGAGRTVCEFSGANATHTDAFLMYRHSAGNVRSRAVGDVGASEFASTSTTVGTSGIAAAVVLTVDKSLLSAETQVNVNGVITGTQTANANNANGFGAYPLYLGAEGVGTSSPMSGGFGEFAMFSRAVTSAEGAKLIAYARATWGTP